MKRLLILLLAMALLVPGVLFAAEFAAILSVNRGPEPDIQEYKLYYGLSEQEVIDKTNESIQIDFGSPATITDPIQFTYQVTVPDASEGVYYFGVTATDTSQNESGMSNIASKRWDFLAPAPLTISIE